VLPSREAKKNIIIDEFAAYSIPKNPPKKFPANPQIKIDIVALIE
jgi:hypothetical protein